MAWVEFMHDFDYTLPERVGVTLAYKAGTLLNVPRAHATAAKDAGKAIDAVNPRQAATSQANGED